MSFVIFVLLKIFWSIGCLWDNEQIEWIVKLENFTKNLNNKARAVLQKRIEETFEVERFDDLTQQIWSVKLHTTYQIHTYMLIKSYVKKRFRD